MSKDRFASYRIAVLFFLVVLFCTLSGCTTNNSASNPETGLEVIDSGGTTITLAHTAHRIVSLNDDATEMLLTLGASDCLVGVTNTAKNSSLMRDALQNTENIGDWMVPSVEKIIALNPDIIIGYSTAKPKNLEKLTAIGVPITYIDCYRLLKLNDDGRTLGILTGHEENATKYSDFNQKYFDLITDQIREMQPSPCRVYFESYTDYSVMTTRSAGGQILQFLNISNLYGNYSSDWVQVSPEWVIREKPDVIMKIASEPAKTGISLDDVKCRIGNRTGFLSIPAVDNGRVYVMHGDLGSSPRSIFGLIYGAQSVYPDLFSDIPLEEIMADYAEAFFPEKYSYLVNESSWYTGNYDSQMKEQGVMQNDSPDYIAYKEPP